MAVMAIHLADSWRRCVMLALAAIAVVAALVAPGTPRGTMAAEQGAGLVAAVGSDFHGVTTPPDSLTDAVAVAGGGFHSLALRADGTVAVWGSNLQGQLNVPSELTGVTSIAAGGYHSLALRGDGTVVAWGDDDYGQADVPDGVTGVIGIAAGWLHSMALKGDGTVVVWGTDPNYPGQIDAPDGLSEVTAIAAGAYHNLALKSDGTVVAWGKNQYGQVAVPTGLTDVTAIAAGAYHSLALKSDGTVIAWGANSGGATTVPSDLTGVVAIAGGHSYSLALRSDSTVVGWGDDNFGKITEVEKLTGVTAIAAATHHSLAIVPPQPQAITFGPLADRVYGDGPITVSATSNSWRNPITFSTTTPETCTSDGTNGSHITIVGAGRCTVTADQAAGSYFAAALQREQSFTVAQKELVVSAISEYRHYGGANPALTPSYDGFVNGETLPTSGVTGAPVLSTTATATSPAGHTYPITVELGTLAARNYHFTLLPSSLTVWPEPLYVIADDQTRQYGAPDPPLTVTYQGFVNGETPAVLGGTLSCAATTTVTSQVHTYRDAIHCGGLTAANYDINYIYGKLTITFVLLTITADNQTRSYGAPDPALTVSYSGFVNGETPADLYGTVICATSTTPTSVAGSYPQAITCGGQMSVNYALGYVPGALTITPAPLTVTADNKMRLYGTPDPPFTVTYQGFVNGETAAVLGGTLSCATTATATSPPSPPTYPITCGGQTAASYSLTYLPGALTIVDGATLTLTTSGPGSVAVSPAGNPVAAGTLLYAPGMEVMLTAQPQGTALFLGWTVDGAAHGMTGALTLILDGDHAVTATFAPRPSFADVPPSHPAHEAIGQLAARGIILGYADGRFGPDDMVLRAQMAALIARAMGWEQEDWGNPFTDQGGIDPNLWRNVGTLAHYGVAQGYGDGTFGPNVRVTRAQAISFITRAMVAKGYWQAQPDAPLPYDGVPAGHAQDLRTFVYYTSGVPDAPTTGTAWNADATRGWFARALWAALDSYWGMDENLREGYPVAGNTP